jgi:hypothetical protein
VPEFDHRKLIITKVNYLVSYCLLEFCSTVGTFSEVCDLKKELLDLYGTEHLGT